MGLFKGIGGGLRSNFEIFFVLTHLKIWIMCDQNLFTELKNLERRPRYDLAKQDISTRFPPPFVRDFL